MKKSLTICVLLTLAACQGTGGLQPIDSREFLNKLDGPKVPSMQDAQLEAARSAEKAGDFKSAGQLYQQMLEKSPENKELMFGLAESYRRQGENDKAVAVYDVILAKPPEMIAAQEGKALALLSKGDFETPVPLFESVLRADPKRWKALNGMGILFTTRNLQPEAQKYFREALKQSPSNSSVMNNLGLSQAMERRFDAAIATLTEASAFAGAESTERRRIELNLALVYAIAGRMDSAKAIASRYFSDATLSNNLGLYAHLANDDQLARAYLNMALSQSKTFYDKAWENLQALGGSAGTRPAARPVEFPKAAPAPAEHPAAAPVKPAPAATSKKGSADDKIIDILNSSGEEAGGDIVKPSPIP